MKDREAIEAHIALLKGQLSRAEGTPTEVYSRIVGYYRSVRNWNAGKREEYSQRLAFGMPAAAMAPPRGAAPAAGEGAPAGTARSEAAAASTQDAAPPEAAAVAARPAVVDLQGAENLRDSSRVRDGFLVFTRETCPNCPPVANYVVASGMKAVFVDVDREEGFALTCDLGVMATPTVLGLDSEGRESFRAFDVATLRTRVAAGLRPRIGERPAAVPPGMA